MTEKEELEALRKILKKVQSPRFWAGLSFIDGCHGKKSIWSEKEQEVLRRALHG
jgi:hypothetical protein